MSIHITHWVYGTCTPCVSTYLQHDIVLIATETKRDSLIHTNILNVDFICLVFYVLCCVFRVNLDFEFDLKHIAAFIGAFRTAGRTEHSNDRTEKVARANNILVTGFICIQFNNWCNILTDALLGHIHQLNKFQNLFTIENGLKRGKKNAKQNEENIYANYWRSMHV